MAKRAMTEAAKEAKKTWILDETAKILLDSSYESIKMSQLAKQLGLSNGSLFIYFETKETLFFQLLWREYTKRLDNLLANASVKNFNTISSVRNFLLKDLKNILTEQPLYILLESKRAAILEKNVSPTILLAMKKELYIKLASLANLLTSKNKLEAEQIFKAFFVEAALLTSFKLDADITKQLNIENQLLEIPNFKRDFKQECYKAYTNYLTAWN
ncbi:MAG: TetR/AcrR family transcriptional regulator [Streptococcaceae bacterium]|jgi:AcrR family transcriptional regulator|nr:TetR/AcrR family transcriptional regulator [Streptococcaceae bacterium]